MYIWLCFFQRAENKCCFWAVNDKEFINCSFVNIKRGWVNIVLVFFFFWCLTFWGLLFPWILVRRIGLSFGMEGFSLFLPVQGLGRVVVFFFSLFFPCVVFAWLFLCRHLLGDCLFLVACFSYLINLLLISLSIKDIFLCNMRFYALIDTQSTS